MRRWLIFGLVASVTATGCGPLDPETSATGSGDAGDGRQLELDEPGAIARVRTLDDLRRQPPFAVAEGVTIRFGVEARTCPVWSGVLLYAYTEGYDDLVPMEVNRDRLGPCWVSVYFDGQSLDAGKTHSFIPRWQGMGNKDAKVFCRPVMFDRAGDYRIAIRTNDGRPLTGVTVRGVDAPVHPWGPLLLRADAEYERIEGPYNFRRIAPARATNLGVGIGLPEISGYLGVAATAGPLPRLIPEAPDRDLLLTIEPGLILRVSLQGGRIMAYRPDWHFLVRWWVNGQPFRPHPTDSIPSLDGGGTVYPATDLAIRMEPDPAAWSASPGDEIGLQVLYCPNGWAPVRNPQTNQHGGNGEIRMSDRVTFRLPAAVHPVEPGPTPERAGGK